jgi:hypothetical protein
MSEKAEQTTIPWTICPNCQTGFDPAWNQNEVQIEQPKVGELLSEIAQRDFGNDDYYYAYCQKSTELLTEQQVSAGLREDLEQLRSHAKIKEVCGHYLSWQCAGEGGFYCLMCRAEAAEASLAEVKVENKLLKLKAKNVESERLEFVQKMRSYFKSFVDDAVRPDEWIMKEWISKCDAVLPTPPDSGKGSK